MSKDALAELDALSEEFGAAITHDITVVVGVLAGIKPVAMIGNNSGVMDIRVDLLRRLGLSYAEWPAKKLTYVSRRQDLADRLAELHPIVWGKNGAFADENREIGRLLGYPATATEYFIRRLLSLATDAPLPIVSPEEIENTVSENFCEFILSPDHYAEELAAYVQPLEAANRRLAPKTYALLSQLVQANTLKG